MLTDSHTHLDRYVRAEVPGLLQRAREAGVGRILTVGMNVPSCEAAIEIAQEHDIVVAAVGFHPWLAEEIGEEDFARLRELARQPQVAAISEIGLDILREPAVDWAKQVEVFRRQLRLAREQGLTVNVHVRGPQAEEALIRILREEQGQEIGGTLHGYTGSPATAQAALELGFHVSVPKEITFPDRDDVRQLFAQLPLERLLVETDASGTARPLPDGRRVEPAYVREVAQRLAQVRGITLAEVEERTEGNVGKLLRLATAR